MQTPPSAIFFGLVWFKKHRMSKDGEEAGREWVAVLHDHFKKVKSALSSRSNMDKTLKEEAIMSVREMETILNKLSDMFLGLES